VATRDKRDGEESAPAFSSEEERASMTEKGSQSEAAGERREESAGARENERANGKESQRAGDGEDLLLFVVIGLSTWSSGQAAVSSSRLTLHAPEGLAARGAGALKSGGD